jgi:tRNA(Ile)-lysidine synthase
MAGMRRSFDHYARPLLDVTRDDTVTACQVEGIEVWNDPHNDDPGFTRVRVRNVRASRARGRAGPGRRRDARPHRRPAPRRRRALDAIAGATLARLATPEGIPTPAAACDEYRAIASRVLRLAAIEAGAIDAELFHVHVMALVGLAEATVVQLRATCPAMSRRTAPTATSRSGVPAAAGEPRTP